MKSEARLTREENKRNNIMNSNIMNENGDITVNSTD